MPTIPTLGRRLAAPLLVLALAGCTDPSTTPVDTLPRKAVSGTVTLDGQPLAQGKITFTPAEAKQGGISVAVGDITDGKYSIDRSAGAVPGKYKVSISSVPTIKIAANEEPGTRPKMDPEKVPAKFNTKTTLTKDITDGSAPIDFDLKSN